MDRGVLTPVVRARSAFLKLPSGSLRGRMWCTLPIFRSRTLDLSSIALPLPHTERTYFCISSVQPDIPEHTAQAGRASQTLREEGHAITLQTTDALRRQSDYPDEAYGNDDARCVLI